MTDLTVTPDLDPTLALFEQLGEIDLDSNLFGGTNLRLIAGQMTTYGLADRMGYISIPTGGMALTRLTLSDQSGRPVIRGEIVLMGEQIGLLGDSDQKFPLACYSKPMFTRWRTYGHSIRFEFQNPHPDAVTALRDTIIAKGFVPFVPTTRADQEVYERAEGVEVKFDLISINGTNSSRRFAEGVQLTSAVLIPDTRLSANMTEYVDRNGDTVQRSTFTSFLDSMVVLVQEALKAGISGEQEDKNSGLNRLSTLTGYNAETGWPNRPSLGYVTPVGLPEISVFPERPAATTGEQAATETVEATSGNTPEPTTVPVADSPFDGAEPPADPPSAE